MSTITDVRPQCVQTQCPPQNVQTGEDPTDPYHLEFRNTSHADLRVNEQQSPVPRTIYVNIVDGFNGTSVRLRMISTDTIWDLKQAYLRMTQASVGTLNLVYNGRPVYDNQTLAELHVRNGAMFIIFHRCNGG